MRSMVTAYQKTVKERLKYGVITVKERLKKTRLKNGWIIKSIIMHVLLAGSVTYTFSKTIK